LAINKGKSKLNNLGFILLMAVVFFAAKYVGGIGGKALGESTAKRQLINEELLDVANFENKRAPFMIDKNIRLDMVKAMDRKMIYNVTLVNRVASEFNSGALNQMALMQKDNVCLLKDMESFFKAGVTFEYRYRGRMGGELFNLSISPEDCRTLS